MDRQPPTTPSRPPSTNLRRPHDPKADRRATVRALQGIALAATVLATGVLGGLVAAHSVGASTPNGSSTTSSGVTASGSTSAQTGSTTTGSPAVTAADPFFNAGGSTDPAPVLSFGGGGPTLRSGGS
jgi:hypothetical protein